MAKPDPAWRDTNCTKYLASPVLIAEVAVWDAGWRWWVYLGSRSGNFLATGTGPSELYCRRAAVAWIEAELSRWCQDALAKLIPPDEVLRAEDDDWLVADLARPRTLVELLEGE